MSANIMRITLNMLLGMCPLLSSVFPNLILSSWTRTGLSPVLAGSAFQHNLNQTKY